MPQLHSTVLTLPLTLALGELHCTIAIKCNREEQSSLANYPRTLKWLPDSSMRDTAPTSCIVYLALCLRPPAKTDTYSREDFFFHCVKPLLLPWWVMTQDIEIIRVTANNTSHNMTRFISPALRKNNCRSTIIMCNILWLLHAPCEHPPLWKSTVSTTAKAVIAGITNRSKVQLAALWALCQIKSMFVRSSG